MGAHGSGHSESNCLLSYPAVVSADSAQLLQVGYSESFGPEAVPKKEGAESHHVDGPAGETHSALTRGLPAGCICLSTLDTF